MSSSPFCLDNIIFNSVEWDTTPQIVKSAIKSLIDITKSHALLIKDLEAQTVSKASKSELVSSLAIKANSSNIMRSITDINTVLDMKVNKEELTQLLKEKQNQIDQLEMELSSLKAALELKANQTFVIDALHRKLNKTSLTDVNCNINKNKTSIELVNTRLTDLVNKVDIFDKDFDLLVNNIKKQFSTFDTALIELNQSKTEEKDLLKLKSHIINELDHQIYQHKQDLCEQVASCKSELMLKAQEISHEHPNHNAVQLIRTNIENAISNMQSEYKTKLHQLEQQIKSYHNNSTNSGSCGLNANAIPIAIQNELNAIKSQMNLKANITELTPILNSKVSNEAFVVALDTKASKTDVEQYLMNNNNNHPSTRNSSLLGGCGGDLSFQSVSVDKYENDISQIHRILTQINDSLIMKVNITELNTYLSEVLSKEQFNHVLNSLQNELDTKASDDYVRKAFKNQNTINTVLCRENIIAKFIWNSNQMMNSYIQWNNVDVNSAPDVFHWEKNSNYVTIRDKGMYLIKLLIFVKTNMKQQQQQHQQQYTVFKPMMKIILDNKPIYDMDTIGTCGNYIVNEHNGQVGVMYQEYINITEPSRISVAFVPVDEGDIMNGVMIIKSI